ncbi:MAG TPA: class I SAM-dependent methyltransferase [Pedococcus sp.]|jgi:ubiquinone/menaquinone biosynthesis C-methylase UbiE|nr:class I SAM-dependent methyltransferase [Pedococcus sp.]
MPRLPVPDVLLRTLSRQLGGPSGPLGALVAQMLNRGNGPEIAAAVGALDLTGTEEVADIGFGGGLGLDLLLEATHEGGRVHGVEPSPDMVKRARKAHPAQVAAGRLALHQAGMESLPIADGALDGWISLNTVYFVQNLPPAFAELRRVLAPSGAGVLGMADPEWMERQPFTKYTFTVRPVTEVVAALTTAGLSVEQRTMQGSAAFRLLVCRPA